MEIDSNLFFLFLSHSPEVMGVMDGWGEVGAEVKILMEAEVAPNLCKR